MADAEAILRTIQYIVGYENATNEDVDLIAYSRDQNWPFVNPQKPDFVVKVRNKKEVREILRLANRHRIPVIPLAAGINVRGLCVPTQGGIILDMREMNKIEIDPEMMTATIQPGVTAGQLSVECKKYGLTPINTSAPDVVSAFANYMLRGLYFMQASEGDDHILSMEIILPSGDIIRSGSAGIAGSAGPHARGGGPNLTGLFQGVPGAFGVATEMTIRLRPFPDHVWIFLYGFDDVDMAIKAIDRVMRLRLPTQITMGELPDISKIGSIDDMAAFGGGIMTERMESMMKGVTPEQFKERMEKMMPMMPKAFAAGCILDDFKERFELYKKKLREVFKEGKGRDLSAVLRMTGGFFFFFEDDMQRGGRADMTMMRSGYYHALAFYGPLNRYREYNEMFKKIAEKHGLDPEGAILGGIPTAPWNGQLTYLERSVLIDPKENIEGLRGYTAECVQNLLDMGIYGWFRPYADTLDATMERWGTTGEFLKKIKMLVDPNTIMNPGRFIY